MKCFNSNLPKRHGAETIAWEFDQERLLFDLRLFDFKSFQVCYRICSGAGSQQHCFSFCLKHCEDIRVIRLISWDGL